MKHANRNPIVRVLDEQGVIVLDGGLATALESRGCDLVDDLWSAKILLEAPDLIREVHLDYLQAGADCIISSSYQATLPGFRRRGLTEGAGRELLALSLRLALEARDLFWGEESDRKGRVRPLVAASIGPYGAFLADGSEYTGRYGVSDAELYEFHRERWEVLAPGGADLLACETIPTQREAEALLRLLAGTPSQWAWFSFSCKDGKHLSDGGRLSDAARACTSEPRVAAIGINCTAPEHIGSLIDEARAGTDKPILVYPNSGEQYDPVTKRWHSPPSSTPLDEATGDWVRRGARGVGGCCRVGPGGIAGIRRALMR
ncbi:MAG: homocysteine S-methyltransferase [Longimicrobiales bacterium]